MEIAEVTEWLGVKGGGVPAAVFPLAHNLLLTGEKVKVIGLRDDLDADSDLAYRGLEVTALEGIYGKALGFLKQRAPQIVSSDVDLMHYHGMWLSPSIAVREWGAKCKKPYIISPHGMLDPWALLQSKWRKAIARSMYVDANIKGAACLHALNREEAQAISSLGFQQRICIIPNGVDLPDETSPLRVKWESSNTKGKKVLLFLSRIHPKKGLLELVSGWAQAHKRLQQEGWVLVIAGWDDGRHEGEVRQLVRELGVEQSVQFVGPQFDLDKSAAYRRADAFILPSFSEGLPMVVLEAWSYGKPVLMTDACNLSIGFDHGAAIKLNTNRDRMAAALMRMAMVSDGELRRIGEAGRILVEKNYTWERVASEMQSVYEWVLGGGVAPNCILDV